MSKFDIYVKVSTPISQSQKVREMFHSRFNGCLVLQLIRILASTKMSNFDINVDRWTDKHTDLCRKVRRSGRFFMQGLMVV